MQVSATSAPTLARRLSPRTNAVPTRTLVADERARRQVEVAGCALLGACGLVLIAFAYNAARDGSAWAEGVFWSGLGLLFGPIVIGLLSRGASRGERLTLVVLLGAGTYVLKVAYSPLLFNFPDEMQHLRTLNDVVQSGTLFSFNPILQISALYPGLEIATSALVSETGLPLFWAGLVLVGGSRLVLCLSLFLVFEQIGRSSRVAGLATLFYMANPSFIYLDGQFGYESLALALVALALFAVVRQRSMHGYQLIALMLTALLAIAAVVITHHFSQFVLLGVLTAWMLADLVVVGLQRTHLSSAERRSALAEVGRIGIAAAFCAAAALAWLEGVASTLVDYLGPNFTIGIVELAQLLSGQTSMRVPFQNGAGQPTPLPEQLVGYLSVLCVLGALPFGLRLIWRHYRLEGAALAVTAVACVYPATLLLRFTPDGVATAGRLPEFLFLGLGFVVALVAAQRPPRRLAPAVWSAGVAVFGLLVLLGGVFTGWGPAGRLPGGFLVSAAGRSVDEQSLATAHWAREVLGPQQVIAADFTNTLVLGSYGGQYPVSVSNSKVDASDLFFAADVGAFQRQIIRAAGLRYLVVDWRLASNLPLGGFYYENQEPDAFHHALPMDRAALEKFNSAPGVSRVFDSGDITIFDVAGVSDAPSVD